MFIGVVGWMVLGIIAGFVATKMVKLRGDDPRMGIAMGAIAAVIGGWLYSMISGTVVTSFNPRSLLFAAIAAVVVLVAWHSWRWKSTT
ncbi:MAG: GlsB/YeaQ/YmgE family stress response membrane protein [Tepidisphaeraceae bacterium]